jgi:hypothetical protein
MFFAVWAGRGRSRRRAELRMTAFMRLIHYK